MVEVNWTLLVYLFIALFALGGYFKGWWKEGVTTAFLTILVLLLQVPAAAGLLIEATNWVLNFIWSHLPPTYLILIEDFLAMNLGIETGGQPLQIEAAESQTWLIILIVFLALAIILSRSFLPSQARVSPPYSAYVVTRSGSFWGAILGGVNGWLIVSLVRAYLDGSRLPGGSITASTAGTSEVTLQAVNAPIFRLLDGSLPWFMVALGLIVVGAAVRTRVSVKKDKEGYVKTDPIAPIGYAKRKIVKAKEKK